MFSHSMTVYWCRKSGLKPALHSWNNWSAQASSFTSRWLRSNTRPKSQSQTWRWISSTSHPPATQSSSLKQSPTPPTNWSCTCSKSTRQPTPWTTCQITFFSCSETAWTFPTNSPCLTIYLPLNSPRTASSYLTNSGNVNFKSGTWYWVLWQFSLWALSGSRSTKWRSTQK